MVTRRFQRAFRPIVITIGRITAGTKCNIIADTAEIYATVRTFSDQARDLALAEITRLADGVTTAHALTAEIVRDHGYPLTSNDPPSSPSLATRSSTSSVHSSDGPR